MQPLSGGPHDIAVTIRASCAASGSLLRCAHSSSVERYDGGLRSPNLLHVSAQIRRSCLLHIFPRTTRYERSGWKEVVADRPRGHGACPGCRMLDFFSTWHAHAAGRSSNTEDAELSTSESFVAGEMVRTLSVANLRGQNPRIEDPFSPSAAFHRSLIRLHQGDA